MGGADAFGLLAVYTLAVRELLLLAGLGIALTSLDDLFIDVVYMSRRLWRWAAIYSRHSHATVDRLTPGIAPRPMAVFVPAWDESEVIGSMLRDFLRRTDYPRYRVFVGVYPNDPDTRAAVLEISDPRIEIVDVGRLGPTTKADCLNAIWGAMLQFEEAWGMRFKAVVLHDAEDVAHPRELKIFHYLIPGLAMVQLPVAPLRDPTSRFIAGHYIDEFAETHAKDLVVREALGAGLPSAGVACAFARGLLGKVAEQKGGAPFDAHSLTEDYELGLLVRRLGGKAALVWMRGEAGGARVVTREHFPATLEAAIRQKTRWLLGIALQGWDRIGWRGGLANRYMLLRDRKALLNALVILIGYFAASAYAVAVVLRWTLPEARLLPPIAPDGSFLSLLLRFTTALLLWRLFVRAVFTIRLHGLAEGLLSVPRAFVGNVINVLAALRALRAYIRILVSGELPEWDKTAHRFPRTAPAE